MNDELQRRLEAADPLAVGEGWTRTPAQLEQLKEIALMSDRQIGAARPRIVGFGVVGAAALAGALLTAAEQSGAVLVTLNNLYAYGTPDVTLTPDTPLHAAYAKGRVRGQMWLDAKAAHDAKRLRATEERASDFIGPRGESAVIRLVPNILAGRSVQVLGSAHAPHTWSYTGDVADTLIACADNKAAWGRARHVPSNPPRTQREVVDDLADAAGVRRVKVSVVPKLLIRLLGIFSPFMRELPITMYQFEKPFIMG